MDALDEMDRIERVSNCRKLMEEVMAGEPDRVVVIVGGEDEIPGVSYCASPAEAVMMLEVGKFRMLESLIYGCECEEGEVEE